MSGWASTGIESLDNVFTGLKKGDNVVWQVDGIEDLRTTLHRLLVNETPGKEMGQLDLTSVIQALAGKTVLGKSGAPF